MIIQLFDNQLGFGYTTRPTSTRTYIAYVLQCVAMRCSSHHHRFRQENTCCCRQYMLLQTIHVVADHTFCCRRPELGLLSPMRFPSSLRRQCMLLQTIHVVADNACCYRQNILLQTASTRTFTAYAVPSMA